MNNLSFEKDDSNQKKSGAEACRSDSDDYTDSEKACINSALNILVYAINTEKKLRENAVPCKDMKVRRLIQR